MLLFQGLMWRRRKPGMLRSQPPSWPFSPPVSQIASGVSKDGRRDNYRHISVAKITSSKKLKDPVNG